MRVITPAMKLDLRLDRLELENGNRLVLKGVAGMLPCEAFLTAQEIRSLLKQALRPRVLWWVLRGA